jgi:transcription elongation factor Elf1
MMRRNMYQIIRDHKGAEADAQLVCPHCQTKGSVRSTHGKVKKGISGGKATAAVLTAGVSMLATGLSHKGQATQLKCSNCGTTWQV